MLANPGSVAAVSGSQFTQINAFSPKEITCTESALSASEGGLPVPTLIAAEAKGSSTKIAKIVAIVCFIFSPYAFVANTIAKFTVPSSLSKDTDLSGIL